MPTYEYRCKDCNEELEVVQAFTDDSLTECPSCGGKLKKVFGNVGIAFKGSGFYKNDSRSDSGGGTSSKSSSTESGSSSDNSGSSSSSESSSASTSSDSSSSDKSSSDSSPSTTTAPSTPAPSKSTADSAT